MNFQVWPSWRSPETAPIDGQDFLGCLSNGWRIRMCAGTAIMRRSRYAWWDGERGIDVPYEPSHPQNPEYWAENNRATLVGWLPLPEAMAKDGSVRNAPTLTANMRFASWKARYLRQGANEDDACEMARREVEDPQQRVLDEAAFTAMIEAAFEEEVSLELCA
jgi:hypothetical protein